MEEDIISFETAKLAKKKGFNLECFFYYDKLGYKSECFEENGSSTDVEFRVDLEDLLDFHNKSYLTRFSAPNQSLLQRWLREEFGIEVYVAKDIDTKWNNLYYDYFITKYNIKVSQTNIGGSQPNTYEEALEEGLMEALKLINI